MKIIIVLMFFLTTLSHSGISQTCFPEKCLGTWEGNMKIYAGGIIKDSINVRLTVEKSSEQGIYKWKTEYLSDKFPVIKDYRMKCPATGSNLYKIDEGDGIELNEYLFDNKLYSLFETSGFLLTSTYELIDDKLNFEVTSGTKLKSEGEVINYSVKNLQKVIFTRKK